MKMSRRKILMRNIDQYTIDYISGVMSLRKPQRRALEILDDIFNYVHPTKNMKLEIALEEVKKRYPICTDFERDFMSLAFVLATGVGKTRLMGAFITYLYTNYGVKNFFVVAPGKIVYNKLKQDLGDPSNPKYVFNGVGCFENPPRIIADDDYHDKQIDMFDSDVKIYVFNIDKFNSENAKMRAINEYLGDSFFNQLAQLDDLVMIMDESHHYHAAAGSLALNEINPVLGIELTATPYYNKGSRQVPFKNAVYEYPLSASISDGYTRTPYAVTRQDIDFRNFGEDELDHTMLSDGLICHETIKQELEIYGLDNKEKVVKPFMMVVCKDTDHAAKVFNYVTSDSFSNGDYRNKTLLIHSNLPKSKKEGAVDMLQKVEEFDNPIEIVIHIDMLKEGWDVNNLYTIVPLRTAASKILREQMVGRGLRLPFGQRTGVMNVDSVMLTAHDKFEEILNEAQRGDSIFKAGNVIKVEELVRQKVKETELFVEEPTSAPEEINELFLQLGIEKTSETTGQVDKINTIVRAKVEKTLVDNPNRKVIPTKEEIARKVIEEIKQDEQLEVFYKENEQTLEAYLAEKTSEYTTEVAGKFIPIPVLSVVGTGIETYEFVNFDLDLSGFTHVPVREELLIQNLENTSERSLIQGEMIDFSSYVVERELLTDLRAKSEIDYEKCSSLLFKLITQVKDHYESRYGEEGMKNIIMMNKKEIVGKIYKQMILPNNFYISSGEIEEEVIDVQKTNLSTRYQYEEIRNLFEEPEGALTSNLFQGIRKGVFSEAKFDSRPELIFARVLESDSDVVNWLRPNTNEFKIYYNRGKKYEPDFVVETDDTIYLVEVKGENMLEDADVIAKKERAIQYCAHATKWCLDNGYKAWKYVFIPAGEIRSSSSFMNLAIRFRGV